MKKCKIECDRCHINMEVRPERRKSNPTLRLKRDLCESCLKFFYMWWDHPFITYPESKSWLLRGMMKPEGYKE